jgi:hypothetical protein
MTFAGVMRFVPALNIRHFDCPFTSRIPDLLMLANENALSDALNPSAR